MLLRKLIKNGCKVYEYPDKFLHMKAYLFDDMHMSTGSFNNDRFSYKSNNELNILATDDSY